MQKQVQPSMELEGNQPFLAVDPPTLTKEQFKMAMAAATKAAKEQPRETAMAAATEAAEPDEELPEEKFVSLHKTEKMEKDEVKLEDKPE